VQVEQLTLLVVADWLVPFLRLGL
jgi:hypothetical protein